MKNIFLFNFRRLSGFLALVLFFLFLYRAYAADEGLQKVKLIPLWKPQAQFTGYYVAYEKGIYKKYGMDVEILEGGPDAPVSTLLKDGRADFGIMWLDSALEWRAQGLKLVNIGQIVQRSALMLVAKRSSGIREPRDLQGKKVNLWEGDLRLQPEAFFRKFDLKVQIIPQSYTVNLFLLDGVEAASAMWYNEYHTILNSGLNADELTTFFFSDYGLNFPEDGIYMLEENFLKAPQQARNFAQASIEGWLYAFTHQEEALDIVLKYMRLANLPANRVHQKWMLTRMKDLIVAQDNRHTLGELDQEDYRHTAEELVRNRLIPEIPDFSAFCPSKHKNVKE